MRSWTDNMLGDQLCGLSLAFYTCFRCLFSQFIIILVLDAAWLGFVADIFGPGVYGYGPRTIFFNIHEVLPSGDPKITSLAPLATP
jgi:hypothetical protein